MGLPMFQEPDEAIAKDAAAKLDRAAAMQRSTIRRQPTVRHSRYNPDSIVGQLRAAEERHRALSRRRDDVEMNAELQIRQMEAEIARLRSRRSSRRNQGASLRDADALVQQSRAEFPDDESDGEPQFRTRRFHLPTAPNLHRPDRESSAGVRDADALVQQSRAEVSDGENDDEPQFRPRRFHLPRPNRESSLRFEVSVPHSDSRSGSRSPRLSRFITPPSSSGSGRNVPDGPLLHEEAPPAPSAPPALTQGFAPAQSHGDDLRSMETPPPETWESTLPPLDRWLRPDLRPERPPHRSIDGLGDRHRSPSLDRNAEEENWANLLTGLEPRSSSTATSFASNGDSGSYSRNSQSTMATSFGEIPADDGCDLDLPPGINEEIAREIREQHRSRDRQRRRNGEPDGPLMTGEQGLRMHEARLRRSAGEGREGSRQIQMIQQIMERFGSREDVPDDWWTIMGWDDDDATELRRESSRSRRPVAELRSPADEDSRESRLRSGWASREARDERVSGMLQQADEIMQRLRSQGSREII